MLAIFQNEAKEKGLSLIPSSRVPFSLLLIHLHNYTSEASGVSYDGATLNSSSYCQLSDSEDECAMIAVYSQSIFSVYPATLLIFLGYLLDSLHQNSVLRYVYTITETFWRLPLPFCSGHFETDIAKDFVYEVRHCTYYSGTSLSTSLCLAATSLKQPASLTPSSTIALQTAVEQPTLCKGQLELAHKWLSKAGFTVAV